MHPRRFACQLLLTTTLSITGFAQVQWNRMQLPDIPSSLAFTMFADHKGVVTIPTTQGFLRAAPLSAAMELVKPSSWGIPYVTSITLDAGGAIIVGSLDSYFRPGPDGKEWTRFELPTSGRSVYQIAFAKDGAMYVRALNVLLKSIDNGISFATLRSDAGAFAFNSKGHLFVSVSGGNRIARSMDGGATWENLNNGFSSMATAVSSIVVDKNDNLYASVFDTPGWIVIPSASDIYTSTNNGDKWGVTNAPLIGGLILTKDDELIVGGLGKMTVSLPTGGRTTYQLPDSTGVLHYHEANNTLYCGTTKGLLYASTDKGSSWRVSSSTLPSLVIGSLVVDAKGRFYAGTEKGLFCSTDNGLSWSPVSPPGSSASPVIAGGYALVLGDSGYTYLASSSGITRTRDFVRWQKCSDMWYDGSVRRRLFSVKSSLYFFNEKNSYLYSSKDGFRMYDSTKIAFKLLGLTSNAQGAIYASARNGVYKSIDNCQTWESAYGAAAGVIEDWESIAFDKNGYGYSTFYGGILRSTNQGQTWERVIDSRLNSMGGLTIGTDGRLYCTTPMNVYSSTDHGSTWTDIGEGLPTWKGGLALDSAGNVYMKAEENFKTAVYWTGPPPNTSLRPAMSICLLPVHGDSLVTINPTLKWSAAPRASRYEVQIARDSLFATIVYNNANIPDTSLQIPTLAHKSNYYWRVRAANESGTSAYSAARNFRVWMAPPQGTPQLLSPADGAATNSVNPTLTWISVAGASCYHLQISPDSLFRWYEINDSSSVVGTTYEFRPILSQSRFRYWRVRARNGSGTTLFSETRSFKTVLSDVETFSGGIPAAFQLYQNYPNPFNPATVIRFAVPRREFLSVKVYSALGQEVGTVASGVFEPGFLSVYWNPHRLSSGVYFCRMQSGAFVQTIKIALIR